MRILIVTPAARDSRKGNRITADRWTRLLRSRYQVRIAQKYCGQPCDLLIALHGRKSAASVLRFRDERPGAPLIVTLTGTDLYRDLPRGDRRVLRSIELADRLIVLQSEALRELAAEHRGKCRAILQSAELPRRPRSPLPAVFEIAVIGHLRSVKDPFRAALAARHLPAESRIRVMHVGGALSPAMQRRALGEMQRNRRYRWLGDVPHARTRRLLARCRALVVSSKSEGGANVVSEAIAARVPVLASRIPGNIGMLGDDYLGFFPVGGTRALRELMHRAETDPRFLSQLKRQILVRAPLFTPERETGALEALIRDLTC